MSNIDNFTSLGRANPSYEPEGTIYDSTQRANSNGGLRTPVDTILKTSQSAEQLAVATNNVKEFMNKSFEGAYLVEDRQVCIICECKFLLVYSYAALSL